MKYYFLLSISFLILCCSCGEATKKTYRINQIDLTVEGPLFDGPNTLQATHVIDLNAIEPNLKADQIEAVKLIKANISTHNNKDPSWPPHTAATRYIVGNKELECCATYLMEKSSDNAALANTANEKAISTN